MPGDNANDPAVFSTSTAGLVCNRLVTSFELASTSTVGKLASITSLTVY